MRKKLFLVIILCACVLLLSACDVSNMSSLSDLSKPYTGIYECKSISLGEKNYNEQFKTLTLELKYKGEFLLSYHMKEGAKGSVRGKYEANLEQDEILLFAKNGAKEKSYACTFKNGKISIDEPFQGKLLHAVFAMP